MLNIHSLIDSVIVAGFNVASAKQAAINAVQDAGGEKQRFVRESFIVGYMASRLAPNTFDAETIELQWEEQAVTIINSKGHKSTELKKGQRRRTEKEEKLYAAGRRAWADLLIVAGIKTLEKRGGARTTKANEQAEEPKEKAQVTPVAKEPKDGRIFIRQQAAMLLAYANKNAKVLDLATRNAIAEFCEAVNSIKD